YLLFLQSFPTRRSSDLGWTLSLHRGRGSRHRGLAAAAAVAAARRPCGFRALWASSPGVVSLQAPSAQRESAEGKGRQALAPPHPPGFAANASGRPPARPGAPQASLRGRTCLGGPVSRPRCRDARPAIVRSFRPVLLAAVPGDAPPPSRTQWSRISDLCATPTRRCRPHADRPPG